MTEIFRPPFFQPDSVNGVPLAGALLYFYTAGTTTPITVYQDFGKSTPHASPVVADASGIFPAIYVDSATYKCVLQTSAGVTVKTYDNINTTASGTVSDATFRIQDDGDSTKQLAFQVSGITTGTTRTLTVQDADGTIVIQDATGTIGSSNSTVGFTGFRATSTDAGAAAGPIIEAYRNSASPAVNDVAPQYLWSINDSGLSKATAVHADAIIVSPTAGAVRTSLNIYTNQNSGDNLSLAIGPTGTASTATAAGTTTLTKLSAPVQYFTGTSTQTVVLPVAAELYVGQPFTIYNNSTGKVTVQSSGANTIKVMGGTLITLAPGAPGTKIVCTCISNSGTGTASWSYEYVTPTTDWVAYTPTFTGFGTAASISAFSRRVGDSLELKIRFTAGTATAVEGRISLGFNGSDSNVTSDSVKVPSIRAVGMLVRSAGAAESYYALIESAVQYLTFGIQSSSTAGMTKVNGSAMLGPEVATIFATSIPLANG